MTLRESYQQIASELESLWGENEARSLARLLLESVTGLEGIAWFMNQNQVLDPIQIEAAALAVQKLLNHEPLQYILGHAWFYGWKLKVSPAVLIPRQETEQLVRLALPYCTKGKQVIDLCTGSGCIAIALKKNAPEITISAVDISLEALDIARHNASIHDVDIDFYQEDISQAKPNENNKGWDVIVANPPYIPILEMGELAAHVSEQEPHLALFARLDDDLFFYKAIARNYLPSLNKVGVLLMELHAALANETASIFHQLGYETALINDIHDKVRFLKVWRE
jgi:release factor glutamine methyltransferase